AAGRVRRVERSPHPTAVHLHAGVRGPIPVHGSGDAVERAAVDSAVWESRVVVAHAHFPRSDVELGAAVAVFAEDEASGRHHAAVPGALFHIGTMIVG